MTTQTSGGAPAPARVYRWESAPDGQEDGAMVLRTDDDSPLEDAYRAQYWFERFHGHWFWCCGDPIHGDGSVEIAPDEDAARRACLLAVLHAPDADEPGEMPA